MISNLDKYKKDIESLIKRGDSLEISLQYQQDRVGYLQRSKEKYKDNADKIEAYIKGLPNFDIAYQQWYSEAKALLRQLLPDRLDDFVRHYEKPKTRKEITVENYSIEDSLQGLRISWRGEATITPVSVIPRIQQQVAMVRAAQSRFESSLFDIRQLLQADLFDSELDAANHLFY